MKSFQFKHYLDISKKNQKDSLSMNAKQASILVFPNGSNTVNGFKKCFKESHKRIQNNFLSI